MRLQEPAREPRIQGACALDSTTCRTIAAALGDRPETVISVHLLRRGLAEFHLVGSPERPAAVIVRNLAFDQDELTSFGPAPAVSRLLRQISQWSAIEVDQDVADELEDLIATGDQPLSRLDDIYFTLEEPVGPIAADPVRLLTASDRQLLERASPEVHGVGWGSAAALLEAGIAAAAIVDGAIVSLAHTSAPTGRHANLSVNTLPGWQRRGFASAAAALVIGKIQAEGLIPVWSAGCTNGASLAIAHRLRFVEASRRTYLIRLSGQ